MVTKVKRAIFAILIIIVCAIIFSFSSQNSEKSSSTSGGIVSKIVNFIVKDGDKVKKESITNTVTFWVRKMAHFSIYTLLGIFLMNEANTFNATNKKRLIVCLIFGILYAASDEFHQRFVSGRSAEIRDVLIDSSGVLFGCILVIVFGKIIFLIKNQIKKKQVE